MSDVYLRTTGETMSQFLLLSRHMRCAKKLRKDVRKGFEQVSDIPMYEKCDKRLVLHDQTRSSTTCGLLTVRTTVSCVCFMSG
jgi:hypothetical protein